MGSNFQGQAGFSLCLLARLALGALRGRDPLRLLAAESLFLEAESFLLEADSLLLLAALSFLLLAAKPLLLQPALLFLGTREKKQ
jgi:hypothetical protein